MFNNKLTLNKEMKGTSLIQRLTVPHRPTGSPLDGLSEAFAFGCGLKNGGLSDDAMRLIRGIFSFDYMGAAEFEWGAVPEALRFIAEMASKKKLTIGDITIHDHAVYYIIPTPYLDEARSRIFRLAESPYGYQLKESSMLYQSLNGEGFAARVQGWLELDNGFMFFLDREMYEGTLKLFGIKLPKKS